MSTSRDHPKRGDIWIVNLDPTVGAEIRKKRPALIVSSDAVGRLPIKLIAPLTGWNNKFTGSPWHVRVDPDKTNRLSKVSAVDALQLRGVDMQRLVQRIGRVSSTVLEEVAAAIAAVVEYQ